MWLQNFRYFAFLENNGFEFNFSNSTKYEKFLKKVLNIIKNVLIFFSLFVSNQHKTLFKMATLTFRFGDQIYFVCSLKNHMTRFFDVYSKLFWSILKKCLSYLFSNKQLKILWMPPFTKFKYVLVFVSLLFIFWIMVGEKNKFVTKRHITNISYIIFLLEIYIFLEFCKV